MMQITSDASSGFITTREQAIGYAVTDLGGKHPSLASKRGLQEGKHLNTLSFLGHWLIACPSTSVSYSQRSATAWRQTTHEYNTGGERYGN